MLQQSLTNFSIIYLFFPVFFFSCYVLYSIFNTILYISINSVDRLITINLNDFILFCKHINNRHACVLESLESFLNRLDVIVDPATRLTAFQQPLQHHVFWTIKEQNKLARNDDLFECDSLVHFPWEPIDKELCKTSPHTVFDFCFEKCDGDLLWHNQTFCDVVVDQRSVLGPLTLLFLTQQVTCRQMDELVIFNQFVTLGALACTWTTKNEDHGDLFWSESWTL